MDTARDQRIYGGAGTGRIAGGSALLAAMSTLAIFLLLPLSEVFDPGGPVKEIRTVDTVRLAMAPPEIRRFVPPTPPEEEKSPEDAKMRPSLPTPSEPTPKKKTLNLPVSFRLSSLDFHGDFDLDFSISPNGTGLLGPADRVQRVFELSEVDHPPRSLLRHEPIYPFRALRRNIEGYVKLELVVTRSGIAENIRVMESSPKNIFDEAAKKAAAGWKFEPASRNGQPVSVRVETTLHFQLEN